MALQWVMLGIAAAAEAVLLLLLTLPVPPPARRAAVPLAARALQPLLAIVPFAAFQLLGARLTTLLAPAPLPAAPSSLHHGPAAACSLAPSPLLPACAEVYLSYDRHLVCKDDVCSPFDRERFERKRFKAQRNALVALSALFFYWLLYRVCVIYAHLQRLEEKVVLARSMAATQGAMQAQAVPAPVTPPEREKSKEI
eukprot:SM000126S26292  [mRNA]  locus=s126:82843:83856:- [translate_table: standard]